MESFDKALTRALDFLKFRPRSEKEIRDKLFSLKYSSDTIDKVIRQLIKLELIDDQKFAYLWAESRIPTKIIGRIRMTNELRKKGISSATIEQVLNDVYSEIDELELVKQWLRENLQLNTKCLSRDFIIRKLIRKGFKYQIIIDALRELDK